MPMNGRLHLRLALRKAASAPRGLNVSCNRGAYSIIEVCVCLGILLLLAMLSLPAILASRERCRMSVCQHNLGQLGRAFGGFSSVNLGYPVGCVGCSPAMAFSRRAFTSWNTQLLPHLGLSDVCANYDFSAPSYDLPNREIGRFKINSFLCPSTHDDKDASTSGLWKTQAFTDYGGLYGVEGDGHSALENANAVQTLKDEWLGVLVYETSIREREVTDGISKTAIVGEASLRRVSSMEWNSGHNIFAQECENPVNGLRNLDNEIGSPHPNGAFILFCDGHITFLVNHTSQEVLNALLTRAGTE